MNTTTTNCEYSGCSSKAVIVRSLLGEAPYRLCAEHAVYEACDLGIDPADTDQPVAPSATVTDYARARGLDPADLMAIISADPEPVTPIDVDPAERWVTTSDGVYRDAIYPANYLDLVAQSIRTDA